MQDNLRLLSDHVDATTKVTPVNLLDELSVKIKAGTIIVEKMLIVFYDEEDGLTIMSSPMAKIDTVGMLTWAANLEMNA